MAQEVDLDEENPPSPDPRAMSMPISPVIIETESDILNLYFTRDLGEVYVLLHPEAGKRDYFQTVNTSI